jgi:hypothetical protein
MRVVASSTSVWPIAMSQYVSNLNIVRQFSAMKPNIPWPQCFDLVRLEGVQKAPMRPLCSWKVVFRSSFNPFPMYINLLTILDTLPVSVRITDYTGSSRAVLKLYTFVLKVLICNLRGCYTKCYELHM